MRIFIVLIYISANLAMKLCQLDKLFACIRIKSLWCSNIMRKNHFLTAYRNQKIPYVLFHVQHGLNYWEFVVIMGDQHSGSQKLYRRGQDKSPHIFMVRIKVLRAWRSSVSEQAVNFPWVEVWRQERLHSVEPPACDTGQNLTVHVNKRANNAMSLYQMQLWVSRRSPKTRQDQEVGMSSRQP